MEFRKDFFEALITMEGFENVTTLDLNKGEFISKTVKEGDRPEEYLSFEQLLCLSAYYEYEAFVIQEKIIKEDLENGVEYDEVLNEFVPIENKVIGA